MSVESLAVVLHHSAATGTAKLVMIGIANHDGDGGAWPSVATLARYANADRRTVQRAIRGLEATGELAVAVQAGGTFETDDARRPNRYRVLLTCPDWCDRTAQHRDTRPPDDGYPQAVDKGAAPTPPGDTHAAPGAAPTPPGGAAPTPPEPSYEPRDGKGRRPLTDRARANLESARQSLAAADSTKANTGPADDRAPDA